MSSFYDGDKVKILFGAYKGQPGTVLRWSAASDLYIVAVDDKGIKIALRENEMSPALTCTSCTERATCKYVDDPFNIYNDCLADK